MNAVKDGNHIIVHNGYMARESLKQIKGSIYDPDNKVWRIPCTKENVESIVLMGAELDDELKPVVKPQDTGAEEPILTMPIKAIPYKHPD